MPLRSTDAEIAALVRQARTRREGDRPNNGNRIADVLDALVAFAHDREECSAERLTDAVRGIELQVSE